MQSLFTPSSRFKWSQKARVRHSDNNSVAAGGQGQSGRTGSSAGGVGVNSEYETLGGVAEQKMADKKRGFNGK